MRVLTKLADCLVWPKRKGPRGGVLLVSAGGIGDTVLFALVLPRFIALAKGGEPVTLILRKDAARMRFLLPPSVRLMTVDFGRLKEPLYRLQTLRTIAALKARLAISTDFLRHPDLDEALLFAAGATETLGMEPRPWPKYQRALDKNRRRFTRLFASGPVLRDKLMRMNAFADWLSGDETLPPKVRLPESLLPAPEATDQPRVLIQPFSAVALKHPSATVWRAVLDAISADHRVHILGAPGDLEKNPEWKELLAPPRIIFDARPFAEILPALRSARLVISVDTGLMHLAAAAGAPTLCLASAAYVGEIVPYAPEVMPENVEFLYAPMPCEGCLGACSFPPENGMYPCVAKIDPARAKSRVQERLKMGAA